MFNINQPILENSRTVHYADPAIGGGKTYSLKEFLDCPFVSKSIIGIQSINLAIETEATLISKGISALRIDTDAFPYNPDEPYQTCTTRLDDAIASGKYDVLICNWEVAIRADDSKGSKVGDYSLYLDEIPPVYERIFLPGIVTSHGDVASYVTSMPMKAADGIRRILITDEGANFLKVAQLEEQAPTKKDTVDAISKIRDTDYFDVFAESKIWDEFETDHETSVVLHVIMKPAVFDKFKSVIVLGANFTWSLMDMIWGRFHGVGFDLHKQIMDGTRYQTLHHKAATTTAFYLTEKNCSKTLYNQIDYQPTYDVAEDAVRRLLAARGMPADTKSLVFINNKPKHVKEKFHWNDENATLLSPVARGWDAYKDIDVAIHLAACNENGDTYRVLHTLYKLTKNEIDRATCMERAYQAIGRCSIRDMHSTRPVILVFFDYRNAKFAHDILGKEGEPVFLDTGLAALAPKVKKTNADYKKKGYHREGIKAAAALPDYEGFTPRLWSDQWAKVPLDTACSWEEYVEQQRHFATTYAPADKKFAYMYREGSFKTADHKLRGNINSSKVITLDFDHVTGDVSELTKWLSSCKISHVIAHSWSSTTESPRFRLDIPLNKPVDAYGYTHIAKLILSDIAAEFGSETAFVGDKSKIHITSKFYVPSVSKFAADMFIDGTVMDGDQPVFLDVMAYMSRDPLVKKAEVEAESSVTPFVARRGGSMTIKEVIEKWAVPVGQKLGSRHFYEAGVDLLFKVGLSRGETIEVLHTYRYRFGDGEDRDAQYTVNDILSRSRQLAA